ncbi:MAG: Glycine betaine methyltransferase [Phycisphaerae bacterium]|nr:Glycine betaine methyltransferase [Phycisphaerae bacterium]
MPLQMRYLCDGDRERIHRDSLRILAEVGVRFHSRRARKILRTAGALADEASEVVRIGPELVEQALKTAPRSFVLGARDPVLDFALPSPFTGYTLDGAATFTADFATGQRRYAVTADLVASLRIFQELELGTIVWPNVVLDDIPAELADVRTAFLSLIHSSKHVQHEIHHAAHVAPLIEGLALLLGGEQAVRDRKIFSVCYCTIPPLTHDGEMCDACLELAEFHVPILPYPMPAAGSTGPASLYSDVAVANAESLSALVLFQLASPGTPIIMGHAAGVTNFSTGGFVEGAPESNLINGALGDMARFYGLPNTQAGCLTDAKAPGAQAMMEKMFTTLPLVLAGVDVINGIGEIATSQLLVLEQIVVDHELARLCRRMKEGVDVADAKDYLADVARVGPGGHFLMEESTLAACRSPEFCRAALVDRDSFDQWEQAGRPDMYRRARDRVERILASPPTATLPDGQAEALEDILRRAVGG